VLTSTFSLGFRFYYWHAYEFQDCLPDTEQLNNRPDHSGFKVKELFIKRKYSSFKEEIASYRHFDIGNYEKAKMKRQEYMNTDAIKKMDANGDCNKLQYGIKKGQPLSAHHILSLILYCDYTKLSTDFSSSFRNLFPFETLKSVKARNSCYYWMSRYLRELVEIFGQHSIGDTFEKYPMDYENEWRRGKDDYDKPLDALIGPFFTGMNCKLSIDSFAMRLNSPTSTTKQIEVALKFSGSIGTVITFVNSQYPYTRLRGWNCSWISNFKEEDEILFFGGFYTMKVANLRLVETNENMKTFMKALFAFDKISKGYFADNVSQKSEFIIEHLIKQKLKRESNVTFHHFIFDCFHAFTENKKQIDINLWSLNGNKCKMTDFIFHPLEKRKAKDDTRRGDDDFHNLIRADLFDIFPNVETMNIVSADDNRSNSFSLIAFLNILSGATNAKWSEINILSIDMEKLEDDWIYKEWNLNSQMLIDAYAKNDFEIAFDKGGDPEYFKTNLKITRTSED